MVERTAAGDAFPATVGTALAVRLALWSANLGTSRDWWRHNL
jgi:hypothetical protein